MKKAFQLSIKKGIIPVFALPHICQNILSKIQISKKFKDYVNKIECTANQVQVSKIEILGVEMFGQKVGFINMRAITKKDGFNLPSYVFLRGNAVAILIIINNQKILLVQQYRPAIQQTLLQAPAGMLDQSGDFIGTAALQIQQQTSIKIKSQDLKSLGGFYPSPGGCDEEILMFYIKINLGEEQVKEIESKIHGKEGESQRIKVKFIQFDPIEILKTKDAKLISLVYAYQSIQGKSQAKL